MNLTDTAATAGEPPGPTRALLDVRDPRAWVALDLDTRAALRRAYLWGGAREPEPLAPVLGERALAVALCHADGRTRETAVRRAADCPALLPLVAIRCTDWAAPVRRRAFALLRTALPALPVGAFCDVAAVVLRVAPRHRGGPALALVEQQLHGAEAEFVAGCLAAPDRLVQRLAARVVIGRGLFTPLRLAGAAATGADIAVQDRFAQAAAASLPGEAAEEEVAAVLALLLGSRQPRVRATGVTALNRLGLPARAEPFLADRAPIVRACARWVLRQHGGDPLPRYRELCADPDRLERTTAAAPAGLGECGERADAALLRPLLAHPLPQVRAQAVVGLRALDVTTVDALLPLVDDPAAAVVRAATEALLPSADRLPEPWFAERLAEGVAHPTRIAATRLRQAGRRHLGPYGHRPAP
ncbi:hypothetical protein [Streptomyces sp. NPDC048442]|uniref:hypothetical protein n=1 Tax=Streptomyces sp. NPDC048442 TaxID=3154823 RepID=UPI00344862B7